MKRLSAMLVCGVVACAAAACNGSTSPTSPTSPSSSSPAASPSSPSSPTTPSSSNGRLLVRLSAGPFDQARAVLVTFSRVRVYRGSPTNLSDVPLSGGGGQYTCDLKKLSSSDGEIAVGNLPSGAYSQVGIVIQRVTVHIDNPTANAPCAPSIPEPGGRSATLAAPAGEIPVPHNFDVKATGDTVLRLNFNTEQSIRVTGENTFSLTPVITVLGVS